MEIQIKREKKIEKINFKFNTKEKIIKIQKKLF
jgi:hypothetical protein